MKKDEKSFIPDSRFQIIWREARLTLILVIGLIAILTTIAAVLGGGDPAQYQYLFGYPKWFAVCFVVEMIFIAIVGWLLLKKFSNISLEADDPEYDYEEDRAK